MHRLVARPFALLAASLTLVAAAAAPATPTLKARFHDSFLVGAAIPAKLTPAEVNLLTTQFDAVTPENCMKPALVHPRENVWTFRDADRLVALAESHHLVVFGHTLVWHQQTPNWFFEDHGKPASRELLLARLKEHVQTVVGRYKGRIRSWDVVNEAISDQPDEYLRTSPWYRICGDEYILRAFQYAHEADPNLELQYNDYGIEEPVKRAKAIRLLTWLKQQGVPITSVGIQGHWLFGHVPFQDIDDSIAAFAKLGLKVSITELDLDVVPRQTTGANVTAKEQTDATWRTPWTMPPEMVHRFADEYGRLFRIFEKHHADIERVTFWGLDDGGSWLNDWPSRRYNQPLLFDRDLHPKPAFNSVVGQ